MREIKFRAWLDNRGMYVINGFQKHLNGITIYPLDSFGNKIDDWYRMDNETTELMQYTGLLDKNCVEIYEGDIVRVKFNNEQVINGEVSFDKGCFMWYQIPQMYGTELVGLVHESEVIGNIYENHELLEVK